MTDSPTPLSRLVLLIVCLSLAATVVAGVHYMVFDLPQQQNAQAPKNAFLFDSLTCSEACYKMYCPSTMIMGSGSQCRDREGYLACQAILECDSTSCAGCKRLCTSEYRQCLDKQGDPAGDCEGIRGTCEAACPC